MQFASFLIRQLQTAVVKLFLQLVGFVRGKIGIVAGRIQNRFVDRVGKADHRRQHLHPAQTLLNVFGNVRGQVFAFRRVHIGNVFGAEITGSLQKRVGIDRILIQSVGNTGFDNHPQLLFINRVPYGGGIPFKVKPVSFRHFGHILGSIARNVFRHHRFQRFIVQNGRSRQPDHPFFVRFPLIFLFCHNTPLLHFCY